MRQPAFGERLREIRQARSLTQRDLAGDFVTPSYISLVEAGRRTPTLDVVVHLSRVLDVPLSELSDDALVPSQAEEQTSLRVLLTEVLARDSMDFDDYETAAKDLREALRAAEDAEQPMRVLDLGMRLQEPLAAMSQHADRVEVLQKLLGLPVAKEQTQLQVILRSDLAGALRDAGRLSEAHEVATLALEELGDSTLHGTTQHVKLLGISISILVEAELHEALPDRLGEFLGLAGRVGGPRVQGKADWVASRAYAAMGDADAARKHLAQAQRNLASPTMPLRDWLRFCRSSAAVLLDIGVQLDEARSWLENADTAARALAIPAERGRVDELRARYELATGDPQRCLEILEPWLEDPDALAATQGEVIGLRLLRAQAMREAGHLVEAEVLLRGLAADAESVGEYGQALEAWRCLDEVREQQRQ